MDLRYPFKIESTSIDGIFSEHTFEHLSHEEVDNALSECYRILKNGSIDTSINLFYLTIYFNLLILDVITISTKFICNVLFQFSCNIQIQVHLLYKSCILNL